MKPQRIQLSRKKGFDLQAASLALNGLPAVMVARPTLYGNPFRIGERLSPTEVIETAEMAVDLFRRCMAVSPRPTRALRGKNLACWCKLGTPCHADVLLDIANA